MNIFKTTAAAVISSLVIGAAPVWSATVDSRPVLATAQAISSNSSAPLRDCRAELARTIRS
jgi:hypothetical protein